MKLHKKSPNNIGHFLVEHLEKSSPLIIEEIHRWSDLLWEDWMDHQVEQKRRKKLPIP
ncbi:MAG TPA: hypothetical protein VN778_00265 [Verrucomicrobiae bacterium]|nr:hypothetical protein [Verrucomicrobiae bacterium]